MATRKNLNPLLAKTENGPDANSEVDQGAGSEVDALADHMASSINVLESKTDHTKSAILRTIDEIKSQIEDERAINEALRSDLEEARKALLEKEKEADKIVAELAAQRTKAGIIEGLKDEIDFVTKELKSAQELGDKQKAELAAKDKAFSDLQTKLIAVDEERSKILHEVKSEIEGSMKLQKELAAIAREKDDAVREKNNLAAKYKTLEVELNRMREESKALDEIQEALSETRRTTRK